MAARSDTFGPGHSVRAGVALLPYALLCVVTGACASPAMVPKAHESDARVQVTADSGPQQDAPDSAVDSSSAQMSTASMPATHADFMGPMGIGTTPSEPCTSDAQCRSQVEAAIQGLAEAHDVQRRVVQAVCVLNPCEVPRRARPVCGCVLAPDDGRELEAYSLGSVGPCAVWGRGPTCLVREDDYMTCDTAVATSCDMQCEQAAEALDLDDARARNVEVRYASCLGPDVGGTCVSVARIDDACYFEQFYAASGDTDSRTGYRIPEPFAQSWDCSLADSEIVSKYYPTPDWEALGCTVSSTTITCSTTGHGGCYLPLCLDPACYPASGLDGGGSQCACPAAGTTDIDAGGG